MRVPRMKTAVPELPSRFVSRKRLLAALDAGHDGVTLVCAPPGYGKTLLLADWTRRTASGETAWLSLDRDDNNPDWLCAAVVTAFARCAAVPGDSAVHQLGMPRHDNRQEFLTDLVDALDALPVSVRLVLDDMQEILEQDALRIVQQLMRHLPQNIPLVLSSRLDPPLPLVRLRLEGRLRELRAEDLRFTRAETAELLTLVGPPLTPTQLAVLHNATDGWPAGVRLAASSLGTATDPGRFLAEFSGDDRSVADYLVGEVLDSLPADTRDFLGVVSVCDPIPVELAAELSGRPDAAQLLNRLERDSALITRSQQRSEYRVHVLLRSYLRAELARQRPALILRLNAAAAQWWADRGRPSEAVQQALSGVPPLVLTNLLRRFAVVLLLTGEHATLRRALAMLGREAVADDPLLAGVESAVRAAPVDREPCGAEGRRPVAADRASPGSDPGPGERPGLAWAVPGAAELRALRRVVGGLRAGPRTDRADTPAAEAASTALDAFVRGAEALSERGDARSALQMFTVAVELARGHGFDYLAMQCAALGAAAASFHDHDTMVDAGRQALSVAAEHGWQRTAWAGAARGVLAYAALLRAEPIEAHRLASQALFDGQQTPGPELVYGLRSLRGAAASDRGLRTSGLQEMQHARADLGARHLAPVQAAAVSMLEYDAALSGGHAAAARTVLNWLEGRAGPCGETQLMRSWQQFRAGDPTAARAALRPLLDGSTPPLLPHTAMEARLVEVQLDLVAGDRASARRVLRRAVADAGSPAMLRPFVRAGPAVHELLVHQVGSFGEAERVAEAALAALRRTEDASTIQMLSNRERAVLWLLPTLLSLEEIAEELHISVNTVKSHTRTIYAKLGVSTRRSAVVAGYERGLLLLGPAKASGSKPGSRPPSRP